VPEVVQFYGLGNTSVYCDLNYEHSEGFFDGLLSSEVLSSLFASYSKTCTY